MEPPESAAGQKYAMETEKMTTTTESMGVSVPAVSAKRSTFAGSKGKGQSQHRGCSTEEHSGKELSSACSRPSQEKQCSQRIPRTYSYRLRHSSLQAGAAGGSKPQADSEAQALPLISRLQSFSSEHQGGLSRKSATHMPTSFQHSSQSGIEQLEGMLKKVPKSKKPGKYICHYCSRACAKPSVLKKHIRSHTGERPYPCIPCGFSFKTKSNLYKHKKSHAHNVKAGLIPLSEITSTCKAIDPASLGGEAEVHSDYEQSTDTDEEVAVFLNKGSPVPHISLVVNRCSVGSGPEHAHSSEKLGGATKGIPIVVASEQGIPTTVGERSWLKNMSGHKSSGDEFPTIKQKLALRLTGKKGQDSGPSMNLLSPHSKGSTDSGYFSRSESAEQQISSPNTNAKSYEEIMFGKFYKLSPRSRQGITSKIVTGSCDDKNTINIQDKSSIKSDSIIDEKLMNPIHQNITTFLKDDADSQIKVGSNLRQHHSDFCQINEGVVEIVSDTSLLVRSNSMPSHTSNLSAPQGLQGSHSFDERMTADPVYYRSSVGLRRLRRQAAFEFIAQEGHTENENSGSVSKSFFPPAGTMQLDEKSPSLSDTKECGLFSVGTDGHSETQVRVLHQKQVTETATRKRRKKKSVGDEEDFQVQHDSDFDNSVEMLAVDYDSKQENQNTLRTASPGTKQMYSMHREPEDFTTGTFMTADEATVASDIDKKTGGNVISVIQHTNSLSRPSSFEKADSVDQAFYPLSTLTNQYSEQSDSEKHEEAQSLGPRRSGSMELQQMSDDLEELPYRLPHKLVRQANIQVPEIRVTEEPDKPEEGQGALTKEPEKQMEDFQWPQRSETLSQLPAEKLPPKKKRLRLAEMEHSSGDSSFESTCTSLSRSPSQESHLSPSSSFSMSFDRDEGNMPASQARQDDFGKQSEFLTVPCSARSVSTRNQSRRKEVRRSSSEQTASALIPEVSETRSKSFDYGGLLCSSELGDVYSSASAMKERRRGYLVRQAPLSIYPESVVHDKGLDVSVKEERQESSSPCLLQVSWPSKTSAVIEKPHISTVHDIVISKKGEVSPQVSLLAMQRPSHLLQQQCLESVHRSHEVPSQEVIQYSLPYTSVGQSSAQAQHSEEPYQVEPTQRISQHLSCHALPLQKLYVRQTNTQKCHKTSQQSTELQELEEEGDSEAGESASELSHKYLPKASPWSLSDLLSKAFSGSIGLLEPVQTIVTGRILSSQLPLSETSVPVRIQTQVPSFDNVMYTNVSHILASNCEGTSMPAVVCDVKDNSSHTKSLSESGAALSTALGKFEEQVRYPLWKIQEAVPAKMNTGIPLTLTSGTISTTDASGAGGNKRILSPANSMELFIEATQQKRVKEERMYGQIVAELSAVELSSSATKSSEKSHRLNPKNKSGSDDYEEGLAALSPLHYHARSSAAPEPHVQRLTDPHDGMESPEVLDIDEASPPATFSTNETQEEGKEVGESKSPLNMLVEVATNQDDVITASTILLTDISDDKRPPHFPSLCTSTSVSWCFLNYTKPNNVQTSSIASVYSTWFVSSYNPNPPELNTKTTLSSLCSKQRKSTESYTTAPMYQPAPVVSSLLWKQTCEQAVLSFQEKPEAMQLDTQRSEKKPKETGGRDRVAEGHRNREAPPKAAEPNRIKIFEGGYKSNEDYVYVRGRGRGKYICEECGIRCKKPSMLKKHIRTHTDVRPYVCKACNFAFKTKGNLTKHMKSKAHMKKCVELGVSLTSVESTETEEADNIDEGQSVPWKVGGSAIVAEHQFSDADDSEGVEEEADENDEDEDEDDEYEGDSTPRTRSRSTSPQPCGTPSLPITASSQGASPETMCPGTRPPFFGLPGGPTRQKGERASEARMVEGLRIPQGLMSEKCDKSLSVTSTMNKAFRVSPDHTFTPADPSPSVLPSPGYDSSPNREPSPAPQRYLCPSRELLTQGNLRLVSPKKDTSMRRGVSPRGRTSSVTLVRPLSPGRDVTCRRELSPRNRHRAIRPVSPRKGVHHHGVPWSQALNLPSEFASAGKSESHPDVSMGLRKTSVATFHLPGDDHQVPPGAQHGLFSHLPLHSQLQVRTPVSVIPIGGIQIIPATASALSSPRLPKTLVSEPGTSMAPICCLQPSGTTLGDTTEGLPAQSPPGAHASSHSEGGGTSGEAGSPDERVRICTWAIASLRISSERARAEPSDNSHVDT